MNFENLRQMEFRAADGHREVLWVEPAERDTWRVLNVPVWLYGISVGTRVRGEPGVKWMTYERTIEQSRGGTVRLFINDDGPFKLASRLYLDRILADAQSRRLGIGPSTFFDPLLVAIHVHEREEWNKAVAAYLNELVESGVIRQWEVGDPDAYPPDPDEPVELVSDAELVHPRPTSPRRRYH